MKTYRNKETGKTIEARQITEPVTVSLATGERTFEAGDYEVHIDGHVHMVTRDEFEARCEPVEPEPNAPQEPAPPAEPKPPEAA